MTVFVASTKLKRPSRSINFKLGNAPAKLGHPRPVDGNAQASGSVVPNQSRRVSSLSAKEKKTRRIILRAHPFDYIKLMESNSDTDYFTRSVLRANRDRINGIRYLRQSIYNKVKDGNRDWRRIFSRLVRFADFIGNRRDDFTIGDLIVKRYCEAVMLYVRTLIRSLRHSFRVSQKELKECPLDVPFTRSDFHFRAEGDLCKAKPSVRHKLKLSLITTD